MLTIHSLLSSFPLHRYPAVPAASSGVSLLFTAGSSTLVWFEIQLKPRQFALVAAHDSNRFPIVFQSNLHPGCGYICFTGRLDQATWCHF